MEKNGFSLRLDAVKIACMFLIVMYHVVHTGFITWTGGGGEPLFAEASDFVTGWPVSLAVFGYVAIVPFFIISGLGLTYSQCLRERSALAFYRRRFVRIMPLYWIVLALTVATIALWSLWSETPKLDWGSILVHIPALHSLSSAYSLDMNGPLWFVGVIVQLYLLFPLCYLLLKRMRIIPLLVLAFLLKAGTVYLMRTLDGLGKLPTLHLPEFVIGMYIGKLWAADAAFRIHRSIGLTAAVVSGVLLFLASTSTSFKDLDLWVNNNLWVINCDWLLGVGLFFGLDWLIGHALRPIVERACGGLIRAGANATFVVFLTHLLFLTYYLGNPMYELKLRTAGSFGLAFLVICGFYLVVSWFGNAVQKDYDHLVDRLQRRPQAS